MVALLITLITAASLLWSPPVDAHPTRPVAPAAATLPSAPTAPPGTAALTTGSVTSDTQAQSAAPDHTLLILVALAVAIGAPSLPWAAQEGHANQLYVLQMGNGATPVRVNSEAVTVEALHHAPRPAVAAVARSTCPGRRGRPSRRARSSPPTCSSPARSTGAGASSRPRA